MSNSKTREYTRSRESVGKSASASAIQIQFLCRPWKYHFSYSSASVHCHIWEVLQQVLKEKKILRSTARARSRIAVIAVAVFSLRSTARARGRIAVIAVAVFSLMGKTKETIVSVVCR